MQTRWLFALSLLILASRAQTDGPGDNLADKVRPVPPPGIAVPPEDRAELQRGVEELGTSIANLRKELQSKPSLLNLLPDVQIYHNAVRYALTYNEFFNAREIPVAKMFLKQGMERAKSLREGKTPWTTATGLVARGYLSRIDGSVQPYGLVVPATYKPDAAPKHRLDTWFHGRGETLSELNFIDGRQKSAGEFTPPDAFVLHLYGRYCNANKLAGEVDLFEALDSVRKQYPIDDNRLVVRGFSMGGAACWQFAVHYAGLWAAAAPGAGFSETPDFLKVFQNETVQPTWYEKKLWHLYDCTDYAANLFNCPTVAYSGEKDRQKQAADMMAKAMEAEGLTLTHIIGPNTEHRYHPEAKAEINRRIDAIVALGRNPFPKHVRFTTWTLRYNEMLWVTVDEMEEHWARAHVDAEIVGTDTIKLKTENVAALTLSMLPGARPVNGQPKVSFDNSDKSLDAAPVLADRAWVSHFRKTASGWTRVDALDETQLHKRHGLQGPIDDAFLDSFVMVSPTGQPLNNTVGKWTEAEMSHAVDHWRKQFRGAARMKNDDAVTDADFARSNLILWGDPSSNKILAKIADKLPIRWDAEKVTVGKKTFDSAHHAPVLIYPNPLNPKRYVVLNSGFTFREYDYLNNARQVPKLPDYAVVDLNLPRTSRAPGGIAAAGFFGERWELKATP